MIGFEYKYMEIDGISDEYYVLNQSRFDPREFTFLISTLEDVLIKNNLMPQS